MPESEALRREISRANANGNDTITAQEYERWLLAGIEPDDACLFYPVAMEAPPLLIHCQSNARKG